MGIKGKEKTGEKFLRAKIHYSDEDWVFFKKIIFSNSNDSWEYNVNYYNVNHDVVTGGIHETLDVPLDDIWLGLLILVSPLGENLRIDFIGEDRRDSVGINYGEIEEIRTYLKLSDWIKY